MIELKSYHNEISIDSDESLRLKIFTFTTPIKDYFDKTIGNLHHYAVCNNYVDILCMVYHSWFTEKLTRTHY